MIKEISVEQLQELMDSNADIQLIDVREPHEKEIADIGGELIPLNEVVNNKAKINKEKQVIIYCRSGVRSGNIINVLQDEYGFKNLYNLKGGILDWADKIDNSITKY